VTGGIMPKEAEALTQLITTEKSRFTAETGVAYGLSTLAICEGLAANPIQPSKHYRVDPCQMKDYEGAAIAALRRAGLEVHFELIEGSSHIMLPKMLEQNIRLDFAFIDGWHTFDYT
jgi:predicted O-methyltransferase YrrM